ncbi:unnamed protein product [Cercopithifilaria johnstoni]|uniref:HTH psq-type domain-containing protein n=1 Tax=Cercopithifilaria johnstoni TaxID=2874296 RepID=A0A8J2LXS6_9BILA|nr:unnamed protein product [Cercopithifilaria johnstoni]
MLQNANSSSSSGSSSSSNSNNSGNNKWNKHEDGDTDGGNGSTGDGSTSDGGGGGAFQPVKPRSMGNLSPMALCVESTTKTDETTVVMARHHIDEMAVDSSTPTTTTTERRKKKPYKELTLEEKVQLIRLAEENAGMSQASIAERYSIAKSNVCRILQRKHEYLRAYEWAGFAGSRKRKLRGDPQHDPHHPHHEHQQQQSRGNTKDLNNFRTLKMANTTNCTVPHNHSANYMEMIALSGTTERATNDNHLIAPQRPTTVIHQRDHLKILYSHCEQLE